jgi:tRNA threonylcarbamoyladenosine biosynthesis protein TsaE
MALGRALGERIDRGMCVVLAGPLGAGKTTFVRGLCEGLGVDELVISPTFILYEEFAGRRTVVHIDLFRLEHEREIEDLGVFELIGGEAVILAEWGERSPALTADADMIVEISPAGESVRDFHVSCTERCAAELAEVKQWL